MPSPLLLLLLLLAGAALLLLRPTIRGNDGVQNYSFVRSLLFDGDLDFTNEYHHYFTLEPRWFDFREVPRDPVTGLPVNSYGIGSSLLWAPFVATAHLIGNAANIFGADLILDGYSRLYENAVGAASCFYASAGLILLFPLLRRFFAANHVFWALLIIWLASPLLFYMYFHTSMSHANSFFLAALLFRLYMGGDSLGRWAALGATASLLVMTRLQDVSLLALVAVGEGLRLRQAQAAHFDAGSSDAALPLPPRLPRYALFVLCAGLTFLPQLLAWRILQGSPFSGPRVYMVDGVLTPWFPRYMAQALFSSFHGLFYWHPALLPAAVGLFLGLRRNFRFRILALTGFSAQTWMIGSWSVWYASAAFGQRMFISALPFLAVGAAALLCLLRGRRAIASRAVILLLILWNFGLLAQYGLGLIPRQAPVTFATIARNNFIELPRRLLGAGSAVQEKQGLEITE